ncbi:MAG TPA: hypothetical protein VKR06_20220 [Ktedonosporobacter sp.]|nr:hypothetical protein [Ktedonosporobacter sp.]
MFKRKYRLLWLILLLSLGIVLILILIHKLFLIKYILGSLFLFVGGCNLYLGRRELKQAHLRGEPIKWSDNPSFATATGLLVNGMFFLFTGTQLVPDIKFHPKNVIDMISNGFSGCLSILCIPVLAVFIIMAIGSVRTILNTIKTAGQTQNENNLQE